MSKSQGIMRTFFLLSLAGFSGTLSVYPYLRVTFAEVMQASGLAGSQFFVLLMVQGAVISLLLSWAGLLMARKTGLGTPIFTSLLYERGQGISLKQSFLVPAVLGIALGLFLIAADTIFFQDAIMQTGLARPPVSARLLACLYGGITEEITMRLFLLNMIILLISLLFKGTIRGDMVLVAIGASALLFSLGHLLNAEALGNISFLFRLRVILLNSVGGLLFGYLYWKRGLAAAMAAHLAADLVVQLLP